jgi:hypothetical protein
MLIVLLLDTLMLISISVVISYWRKENLLTDKRFAILASSFWSFVTISFSIIYGIELGKWLYITVGSIVSIFQFIFLYFIGLWFYRRLF